MKLEIDTTQSIEDIIKQVKEAKAKQPKKWRAEKNRQFYYINGHNKIIRTEECFIESDDILFEIGNYFQTKEEAKQEAKLCDFEQRVAARIKELNGGKVYKFQVNNNNYTIDIDLNKGKVGVITWTYTVIGQRGWWSDKKETIEQVIKEFGEESFIKWAKGEL